MPQPPSQGAEPVVAEETLSEIEILALEVERFRRLTVPVIIGGEGPFDFLVDTGSQATVVSSALAERLALTDRQSANLVGMASERPVETTMVEGFTLGSRTRTIRTAPILEATNIGGADGILGLDSLQDQRVLLDFRSGEMHVVDSLEEGRPTGFEIVVRAQRELGQLIIHRALVDGVRTAIIIDTGATGSIGNPALRERLRRRHVLEQASMTDVNGVRIVGDTQLVRALEIDRIALGNVAVTFADSPTFRALGLQDEPAMILGMTELRVFERVAIDFRTRQVMFDVPRGAPLGAAWNFNERASRLP
ncbi:hypothetical protein AAW00_11130 [Aurantiacibacter luteus]|uniref:Peptidase A2 domain-containing protein n=1 Tax=Aurantiacibacter luteus TaxID=1581420 RepID=A0A0G9MWH2_9SPHN|nr:hypothetical protein AAW00_11130 [Aurantiacibacter luteus]